VRQKIEHDLDNTESVPECGTRLSPCRKASQTFVFDH
jgi:hypothetical protein